jgi:hypothetical protein
MNDVHMPAKVSPEEVHVACESRTWAAIQERLRADAPNEACTFVLTAPSRGATRTTVILREPIWPEPGEVLATPYNLEIHADYISRVMDSAIDAGEFTGIALVHTHPETEYGEGIAEFSARDDWYEARLFPTLTNGRPSAISASIVLGSAPAAVDARIWWNAGHGLAIQNVEIIRVVGPEVTFLETPHSRWVDHPDPDLMDRSTRLWGREGRRRLQNLRVGVVGAGGTGSISLITLANMGVGSMRGWDRDTIKKENLHRTLAATRSMIGMNKVAALSQTVRDVATADPFVFEAIEDWATTEAGITKLKDCDIVFCCVDKFGPRVPLNDFAYAHLVPVIDMASWIHPDAQGVVDAIMTHAHVWSPGIPCAWCRQTLTSFRLMREAQGDQRGMEDRIAYGLTFEETDGVEPSVMALNVAGVGLALLQFMQVAMRITGRTPRDLKLLLPEWELDESDLSTLLECTTEQNTARGDSVSVASTS